jgi:hypothetical protein
MSFKSAAIGGLLSACALAIAGCATHYHPYYGHGPVTSDISVVYVRSAPPPPRRIRIPPRPSATAVWVDGYWNWTGATFVWVDGFWERHPRSRAWVPDRWVHTDLGWYRRPGRWK